MDHKEAAERPLDMAREKAMARYQPDILAQGLDVIFCGLNPALSAAVAGHNFSSPSNRFWAVLHRAGFTSDQMEPRDEQRLLECGCGITAIVRRPTRRSEEVSLLEFRRARPAFEAKMRDLAPRAIAFLGKRGFSAMMGQQNVAWGPHAAGFAGAVAWVLPNPSGLNRSFTLDALVRSYSELHSALNGAQRVMIKRGRRGPRIG